MSQLKVGNSTISAAVVGKCVNKSIAISHMSSAFPKVHHHHTLPGTSAQSPPTTTCSNSEQAHIHNMLAPHPRGLADVATKAIGLRAAPICIQSPRIHHRDPSSGNPSAPPPPPPRGAPPIVPLGQDLFPNVGTLGEYHPSLLIPTDAYGSHAVGFPAGLHYLGARRAFTVG